MAMNGAKLPETCWALTNPVAWRDGHTAEAHLPPLIYHLLTKD